MLYVFFTGTACLGRSLSIEFNKKDFHVDTALKIIVCVQKPHGTLDTYDSVYAVFGQKMLFKKTPGSLLSDSSYVLVDSLKNQYELFFTQLPIVAIASDSTIVDQQVPGHVLIHDTSSLRVDSYIGIEVRGGSSRFWPKRKYEIQFWVDSLGKYIWDPPLFGMRADKDWILEAMYNEPMRVRSFTNWQIWRKTHTLYYGHLDKEAKPYVNGRYVEVFLNGRYQGVYALTEKMDRKQLRLKKSATNEMEGELYKAYDWGEATQYFSSPSYDNDTLTWGGYEVKYPNENDSANWGNIYEFTDFVVNSTDEVFLSQVKNRFYVPNAVDYFLFLNLITGYDNYAKNLFTAKYDKKSPYFYVPWDLDGTWGVFWDGNLHGYTEIILTNRFYDRLLSIPELNFRPQLERRWAALRQGPWQRDVLEAMFSTNRNTLLKNNVYRREHLAWPAFSYSDEQFVFLQNFMYNRIKFLDTYFHFEEQLVTSVSDDRELRPQPICPNPASAEIRVCQNGGFLTAVDIIDISGKIVHSVSLYSNCGTVDISTLKAGLYMVRCGNMVQKLVVQNTP